MTRPEAAKRLGIKAMADAKPGITYRQLARLFAASFSTVRDALRFPVSRWATLLASAPPAPAPAAKSHRAVTKLTAGPAPRHRPCSRDRAKLVDPEPTVDYEEPVDFDSDPQPDCDEAAHERAILEADDARDRFLRGVKGKIGK